VARRIRLDGPAVAHHVMVRGLDGAVLFIDADDRQDFVDRVSRIFPECGARCFGWALLSTHGHFVIQTDAGACCERLCWRWCEPAVAVGVYDIAPLY